MQQPTQSTLEVIYENWRGYHEKLRNCIAPLTDEQLDLQPATGMWPLGQIVQHIISVRAGWFSGTLQDDDEVMHEYMMLWGQRESPARSAAELWNDLLDSAGVEQAPELETILSEGCLARRMLRFVGIDDASPAPEQVDEDAIVSLADAMCDSLENGEMLTP